MEKMENLSKTSVSRRSFIKKTAVTAGAFALIVQTPAFGFGKEMAMQANSDLDLAVALGGLEALAITAYQTAAGTNLLDKPVLDIALKFVAQHQAHQKAWEAEVGRLGGKAVPLAIGKYPDLKSQADILAFAKTLEEAAVGSYYGAILKFQDPSRVNIAASIMPIEAQHVAVYAAALKQDPIPSSFPIGLSEADFGKVATALAVGPAAAAAAPAPQPQPTAGATTPVKPPATGQGGTAGKDDNTAGVVAGTLAAITAAAAGALALRKRNATSTSNKEN